MRTRPTFGPDRAFIGFDGFVNPLTSTTRHGACNGPSGPLSGRHNPLAHLDLGRHGMCYGQNPPPRLPHFEKRRNPMPHKALRPIGQTLTSVHPAPRHIVRHHVRLSVRDIPHVLRFGHSQYEERNPLSHKHLRRCSSRSTLPDWRGDPWTFGLPLCLSISIDVISPLIPSTYDRCSVFWTRTPQIDSAGDHSQNFSRWTSSILHADPYQKQGPPCVIIEGV